MKEKISVEVFTNEFIEKKITNTKYDPEAVANFIREKLEIIEYLPFKKKRQIVNMIVNNVIREEDGVKKVDSIAQFLSFMTSMLIAHTNLDIIDAEADYDALSRCGLIESIVSMFQSDYTQCEALLKAAVADELQDNNLSVVVGKFLNGVLAKFDGFGEVVKGFAENLDLSKLLGTNIKEEDVAKILGFVDKYKN